jgi:alpha-1,2-mannosyltransferase
MAYQRAVDNGPDLAGFCDAGRHILDHGTRDATSSLSRYWPSVDVPWIVFARMPISVVAVVWYGFGCLTWLGLLRTIRVRLLVGLDPVARRHAVLAAGLLAMPLVLDGLALGSFHILMVWLMVLGLDRACRGQETAGGLLLGTAAWLKLLPLLGIGFLLYHRKWKGALVGVATVAVLEIGLSVLAFGPAGAWREHVAWWHQGATRTADNQLTSPLPQDEDRLTNQSVAVTLRRLLTSLGTVSESECAPGAEGPEALYHLKARRRVQIADLSPGQLKAAYLAVMALLAIGVAVYCRPVNAAAWQKEGPAKIVMLTLATLWFSPVVWSYHFVAAAPALATLLLRARYRWQRAAPVVVVWIGSLCLLASHTVRAAGVLLGMSLLLGIGLVLLRAEKDT